jgi:hypothetical protein
VQKGDVFVLPASNAWQNGALKRRRLNSLSPDDKDIATRDLLKVCVSLGVKVHHITVTILLGIQLSDQDLE